MWWKYIVQDPTVWDAGNKPEVQRTLLTLLCPFVPGWAHCPQSQDKGVHRSHAHEGNVSERNLGVWQANWRWMLKKTARPVLRHGQSYCDYESWWKQTRRIWLCLREQAVDGDFSGFEPSSHCDDSFGSIDGYVDPEKGKIPTPWTYTPKHGVSTIKKKWKATWESRLETLAETVDYWIQNKSDNLLEVIELYY